MAKYWVGGAGTWDATTKTNWSDSDGGGGGADVPTSTDDVIFNGNSNATAYTVVIGSTRACANLTVGNPGTSGVITWTFSSNVNPSGNVSLPTGGVFNGTGKFAFSHTSGTKTLLTNGCAFAGFNMAGAGGTTQLSDDANIRGGVNKTQGAFFLANSRKVKITTSTTGLIAVTTGGDFTGDDSFYDLEIVGSAAASWLNMNCNVTVTGTLTLTGSSSSARLLFSSSAFNTQRTVTAATVVADKVDFRDIIGAGAASWDMSLATGYTGNCGGNSMKALGDAAFTAFDAMYWQHGADAAYTWTSPARWFLDTGGGGGAGRVPLPQDTAIFDANSFGASGKTVNLLAGRFCDADFRDVTNTPTITPAGELEFYGGLQLGTLTWTDYNGYIYFYGRGNYLLKRNGVTFGNYVYIDATSSGKITLVDALVCSSASRSLTLNSGELDCAANNAGFTFKSFMASSGSVVRFGVATYELKSASSSAWTIGSTATAYFDSSTVVKLTGALTADVTFASNGTRTYPMVWVATTNAYYVTFSGASNTYTELKIDGGCYVKFTANTTSTIGTFTAVGTAAARILLASTTTTAATLTKAGGGVINTDFLTITKITATPASTWYAGYNSINNGGNSGWIWSYPGSALFFDYI